MRKEVLRSAADPATKTIYENEQTGESHYVVSFYEDWDNSTNLCCSSQIGCAVKCGFCATGDSKLRRNLTPEEMEQQYWDGIESLREYQHKNREKLLYILLEGMGEPTHNLDNCLTSLERSASRMTTEFDKVVYKVSTAGNVNFIQPYMVFVEDFRRRYSNLEFQFQVSLHSAIDEERRRLVPNIAHKTDLRTLVARFSELAEFLNMKLKCNYLLLNYPWGGGNYDEQHLQALTQLLDPETSRIKLTGYSETGKGFSSPEPEKFEEIGQWLCDRGYEVQIKKLLGADILAACGMLHYENPHQQKDESLIQLGRLADEGK